MALVINLKADTNLVDRSENTTRFYKDLHNYKPFTPEEEIEWFRKMKYAKTEEERLEIRNHIVKCNQRLVLAAAKNWSNTDNFMDYTNEANIGLIKAVEAFDYTRGVRFASFAMWYLKRSMNECLAQDQIVKRTNYSKTFHVISKAVNSFIQKNERTPTSDELMEAINDKYKKGIKDKNDLLNLQMTRIDYDNDEESNYQYGNVSDFNRASASYNTCLLNENEEYNREFIASLFDVLTPREQEIIKMHFGFSSDGVVNGYQIDDIAERLGLTKERIRQIEKGALKKMKEKLHEQMNKLI